MKKRVLFILLIMYMVFAFDSVGTTAEEPLFQEAEDVVVNGVYNDTIKWKIEKGILTISGKGEIGYATESYPWEEYSNSITKLVVKKGITAISGGVFADYSNMASVLLPDTLTYIGANAFKNCISLESVRLPDALITIGYHAFEGCAALTDVNIPEGLTDLEDGIFKGCSSLANIDIPNSVISIGEEAFCGCESLINVNIPDGVIEIGKMAFYECKGLVSVHLPDALKEIPVWGFRNCYRLKDINMPSELISIGFYAFDCTSLESLFFPVGLKEIGVSAFGECWLSDIYYAGSEEEWENINISYANYSLEKASIHYDSASVEDAEAEIDRFGIAVGKTRILSGISGSDFVYKSKDTKIVKVNKTSGKIKAVGEGRTKVEVSYKDANGNERTAYYRIYVTNPQYHPPEGNLLSGYYYVPNISGVVSASQMILSSDNPSVVYATNKNAYYVQDYGTAILTIEIDGVTFKQKVRTVNPRMEPDLMLLVEGKSRRIKLPGLQADSIVTYKSLDESVATVSKKGKVTAKGEGSTYIQIGVNGIKGGENITYYNYCNIIVAKSSTIGVKAVQKAEKAIGSAYSQAKRMQDGYYDCSSLIWRVYKEAGLKLGGYSTAPSAAELAKKLEAEGKVLSYKALDVDKLQPGDIIFYKGSANGRYMNIYHVALYYGTFQDITYLGQRYLLLGKYGLILDATTFWGGVNVHQYMMDSSIAMIVRP